MSEPVELVEEPPGSGLFIPPDDALVLEAPADTGLFLVGSMDGETLIMPAEGPVGLFELVEDPVAPGVRPSSWSVQLCRGWRRIGECAAYSFRGVERFLQPGQWVLDTSPAGVDFGWYETDDGWAQWGPRDVDSVRVVEDGRAVYHGRCTERSGGIGGFVRTVDENGERWQFSGPDLWHLLAVRRAFPTPGTDPPWADSHHQESGVASDVITTYLLDNVGASALESRAYPGFGVTNESTGLESQWSARLQPLSDLVIRIAQDAGLGIWLSMSFAGVLSARVGRPVDRSSYVWLSDRDDLARVEVNYVDASVTWALSGGSGEGTSRVFRTSDSGATGWERREDFGDISALSESDEVQLDADTRRRSGAARYRMMVEITDEAAGRVNYPYDISLGDSVTVVVSGTSHNVPLVAAEFELTAARRRVIPVFGEAIPNALRGFKRDVGDLSSRLDNGIA